jgi:hypothetical protein
MQNVKAARNDLYVFGNEAFLKLVFKNRNYFSNPTVDPAMTRENQSSNPQQFIRIMDSVY